ncbi:MAG TPA: glycosyltransferase family 4 protein [Vicinamibacterales bacterium]|nr:glycosyltransferase family 4 protein [Vicinamibacterales bacterium]
MPMRICLVTPYDLSHDGGVNRHVITLARALRHLGHETQVLGPASGATPPWCDSLPGVVPLRANGSRARVGLLVSRRAVQRYLEEGDFDLVHVHEPWVPGPARYAVQYSDAPLVATFHTYAESESCVTRMARRVLARPLRRINCAIAVSGLAADFARGVFCGPIHVVPNGIDSATFANLHSPRDPDMLAAPREPGPLRLLFVGRFDEPRKGLRHFLAAAALIRRRGRHIQVRIVGHGDPRPFQALADRAGARFFGRLDDESLAQMYRWCDVFCAPSTHGESFGVVLIEAMASGRPVVASNIPGYRDATVGAAILVPPGDDRSLADAILRMADDERLRVHIVKQGWQRAHQLAWSRVVLHINSLYEDAAAGRSARRDAVGVSA